MPRQKYREDYEELAEELGWQLIGQVPNSVTEKTKWICVNGHEVERSYKRVKERGCVICNKHWLKSEADYKKLAQIHGIEPPSEIPANVREPAVWKSEDDQEVIIPYRNLLFRQFRLSDGDPIDKDEIEHLRSGDFLKSSRSKGRRPGNAGAGRRNDSICENQK